MKKRYIYFLLAPGAVFVVIFGLVPLFKIILTTFKTGDVFSLEQYLNFFKDPFYMEIYLRTIKLSFVSTLICIILGFPTGYYISKKNIRKRGLYIALAVFPLLTSPVVRSFSWMVVLGKKGLLNTALMNLNIIQEPLSLLYNEFSIIVGFIHLFLPLMVLSLVGVMENISDDYVMAAESLGASKLKAFLRVIFPLSIPGLVIGSVLVFTGCFTAYTTPQLLGGTKTRVMATLIYQNAMTLSDWNTASVVAVIMIVTTMIITTVINNLAKKINAKG